MQKKLLNVYAVLLLLTAIAAWIIIGSKTSNLGVACLIFSLSASGLARRVEKGFVADVLMSYLVPFAAFLLFAYRAAINLLALIGIVQHELDQYDAYSKCLNLIFLIFLAAGSLTVSLIIFANPVKINKEA